MTTDPTLSLTLEHDGAIALLELNHGKANEMGRQQLREIEAIVARLTERDGPRALITWSTKQTSRGTPIFVAGANVTERVGWTVMQVREHVRWQRMVLASLRRAPVFHVAIVSGMALGWGTEFMLTGDYRLATPQARFALPETGLGILPGAGGTSELWTQIGLPHALRLGMTGEQIDADEALRIGLVQERVADLDAGLARARALALGAARCSPTAIAAFKLAALRTQGQVDEVRSEIEARAYEICVESGDAAIGRDHFEDARHGRPVPWGPRRFN